MKVSKKRVKYAVMSVWLLALVLALSVYFFDNSFLESKINLLFGSSIVLAYIFYLVLSCLRGFFLIPVTYFIIAGIIIFPPLPLYILTMIGVMVSSVSVYYFSEYLDLDKYFKDKYEKQINKLKEIITKNELPIVTAWSFFPFLPTDLMCYVCGSLEIPIKKFLFGVLLGEGIACYLYIFLGKELFNYIKF